MSESPFVFPETAVRALERTVAVMDGPFEVPRASSAPQARSLSRDAFFEDEWALGPTAIPNPRNVHYNRFTTVSAAGVTEQTLLTKRPNPLDPRVTAGLAQPEVIPSSRAVSPGELYWVFVPDAYLRAVTEAGKTPHGAGTTLPTAHVSVLFGVGLEVNRHGLRSFFANTPDRVLIEVGGVESVPEATGPWGIGITDAMIAELVETAVGTKVPVQVNVLAAYSTGYRGLNGTINNALVDLTHLAKVVFYDCLYRADGPKAPSGAAKPPRRTGAPANSAFNTWRALQAVSAANSSCRIIVYEVTPGGTPTAADGTRMVDIPGATFIQLKPLNVALKALILARLMDNGIKDAYFPASAVPAGMRALFPLLPMRGTLASDRSTSTAGTIGRWASDNATKIAASVKGFAVAMELARKHQLMGWATPPTEFGHDGFLPEFGWEHLPQ
jgi:hypothetical protein